MKLHTDMDPFRRNDHLSSHTENHNGEVKLEFHVDVANDSQYDSRLSTIRPDCEGESDQMTTWNEGQLSILHSSETPFVMKVKTEEDI